MFKKIKSAIKNFVQKVKTIIRRHTIVVRVIGYSVLVVVSTLLGGVSNIVGPFKTEAGAKWLADFLASYRSDLA